MLLVYVLLPGLSYIPCRFWLKYIGLFDTVLL